MASSSVITCPSCQAKNRVGAAASGTPRCAKCQTPLPWLVDASAESFKAEVTSSVPVIVDFWAGWCRPCLMVAPVLKSLSTKHAGQLKVVKLDVDAHPQVAGQFGAQSIPLLVLFKDGEEVDRVVGAAPESQLQAWLAPHLAAQ